MQGNRSNNSGLASQDGMEIAWIPPSHFAAHLEALARLAGTQQVRRHMPRDAHIVPPVTVAQALAVLVKDGIQHPVQAVFDVPATTHGVGKHHRQQTGR